MATIKSRLTLPVAIAASSVHKQTDHPLHVAAVGQAVAVDVRSRDMLRVDVDAHEHVDEDRDVGRGEGVVLIDVADGRAGDRNRDRRGLGDRGGVPVEAVWPIFSPPGVLAANLARVAALTVRLALPEPTALSVTR